ncbi:MAG TPA: methyltransferase domain-containing protein [Acetobacteraceae bacterium]
MTTLPPDFWESRFQEGHTPWERGEIHPAFLAWRASGALAPCRILVPGAGRSPEPAALLEAGFDVTALDLSPSAVSAQQEHLGAARAVQADVTLWQPGELFDAVYDQTCLCALPPDLWPAYAAQLHRWVRPGGALFMLFMQTGREGGPPFDCPIPQMRALFRNWEWPATLEPTVPHGLGGAEQPAILRWAPR